MKNEYGSVNPGRGGSAETQPADEEARVSTPRRTVDTPVVAESRDVACDADVCGFDAWRAGSREEEAAARAQESIRREVPRASPRAPRRTGVTGDETITNVMVCARFRRD